MKRTTALLITTLLAGCTSPAAEMTPQQVSMLSNEQLCSLHNNYPWEQNTEIEIGKRNLICDPAINECLGRGNKLGTPALALCVQDLRQSWAMQEELEQKEAELKQKEIQLQNQNTLNMLMERNRRPRQVISGPGGSIVQY